MLPLRLTLIILLAATGLTAYAAKKAKAFNKDEHVSFYAVKIPEGLTIDSIAVHKAERELLVFSDNQLVKIYRVPGQNPEGCKRFSGDCKTPEGLYHITHRNEASQFHRSLGISYPNAEDIAYAKKYGKSAGGDIMIHGLPNRDANVGMDRYQNDWTWGCMALRNEQIDEIFMRVEPGTPILITP